MSKNSTASGRKLSFVEVSDAPNAPGIHLVVLHYSDGTRSEQRFTCRRQFEEYLERLDADIRARGQNLVPLAGGVQSSGKRPN